MRIGVFVCHCGSNIAGTVDCKAAAESALSLPDVVYAADIMYTCAEPGQAAIEKACKAIEDAIAQLVAVDQPVYCEKTYIRIKVVYENGGRVPNGILFTMDRGGYGTYNSYTYDGVVGYALSTADAGMESMTVSRIELGIDQ